MHSGQENRKAISERAGTVIRRWPVPFAVAAAVLILLAGLWLTRTMGNASTWRTGTWDNVSESLVFGRILQMQKGQTAPGGLLGVYGEETEEPDERYLFREDADVQAGDYHSYSHQTGLQGLWLGALNRLMRPLIPDGEAREVWLYTFNSTLFYSLTIVFALALWRCAGVLPALAWLGAAVFAPFVQQGMKSLYWSIWTWLLPAAAGLLLAAVSSRRGRVPPWCGALVLAACAVRCMCGFEFISAILMLCEAPLVWCWAQALAQKKPAMPWIRHMTRTGLWALGGAGTALAVWLCQGRAYFGSWAQAWENIRYAAASRMSVSDADQCETTVGRVLNKYFWQMEDPPVLQAGGVQITMRALLTASVAVLAGALALVWLLDRARTPRMLSMAAVWLVCTAAPASWMILSKAHSDIHTHILPMLLHFAAVPAGCALIAFCAQEAAAAVIGCIQRKGGGG